MRSGGSSSRGKGRYDNRRGRHPPPQPRTRAARQRSKPTQCLSTQTEVCYGAASAAHLLVRPPRHHLTTKPLPRKAPSGRAELTQGHRCVSAASQEHRNHHHHHGQYRGQATGTPSQQPSVSNNKSSAHVCHSPQVRPQAQATSTSKNNERGGRESKRRKDERVPSTGSTRRARRAPRDQRRDRAVAVTSKVRTRSTGLRLATQRARARLLGVAACVTDAGDVRSGCPLKRGAPAGRRSNTHENEKARPTPPAPDPLHSRRRASPNRLCARNVGRAAYLLLLHDADAESGSNAKQRGGIVGRAPTHPPPHTPTAVAPTKGTPTRGDTPPRHDPRTEVPAGGTVTLELHHRAPPPRPRPHPTGAGGECRPENGELPGDPAGLMRGGKTSSTTAGRFRRQPPLGAIRAAATAASSRHEAGGRCPRSC